MNVFGRALLIQEELLAELPGEIIHVMGGGAVDSRR